MNLPARLPAPLRRVTLRAILYMCLSGFSLSFVEIIGQFLVGGVSLYEVVWGRYAFHVFFMLTILGPRYKTTIVKTNHLGLQIIRSLTMFVMPVCAIISWQNMPIHDSWAVYWIAPLIMLILSVVMLREPVGTVRWAASIGGFMAMLLIFKPDGGVFLPAMLLSIGMAVSVSLHLTLSRILRDDHPLTSLFHTALWVLAVMSFVVLPVWQVPSLRNVVGMAIIAIVGLIGLWGLARSGELVPIPKVAFFFYSEAIWRLLINVLILGMLPDKRTMLGVLIIMVISAFMLYYELRQPDPAPEHEHVPARENKMAVQVPEAQV